MNGGWGNLEVGLEVGFSRRSAVDLGVGVDKCQILSLQGSEGWLRRCWRRLGHKTRCFSSSYTQGRNGEVNVRYRVELSETEREELEGMIGGGSSQSGA